jgi:hypothetical protein
MEISMLSKRTLILLWLLSILVIASCRQQDADDVVTDGASSEQAETPTLVAPAPTATSIPATATALPPSATPLPTETPPPSPTPTATVVRLSTAADFGEARNPLTGEEVEDPAILDRRPIAVKIPNFPAGYVRPQSGVNMADLVFEHITEGPITRFTAIFYDETPEDVGPIRSARLIDIELPAMYDAALAYSGSSIGVAQRLADSDFRERILRSNTPGYYRTGADIPYEHTLYGEPALWWEALEERGENRPPVLANYMTFSSEPPAGGEPVTHINVDYRARAVADWSYDAENGRYWRESDGEIHLDENTGEQLNFANVVVVFAHHQINYSICETQIGDTCQAFSTEIQIWGEGPALIFRDGRQYQATWHRAQRDHLLTFTDAAGEPVPLAIGNTWFQMVPDDYIEPVTVEP